MKNILKNLVEAIVVTATMFFVVWATTELTIEFGGESRDSFLFGAIALMIVWVGYGVYTWLHHKTTHE